MIDAYFRQIDTLLSHTSIVHSYSVTYDKRSTSVGFIRGSIYFVDGSILYLREFVNAQHDVERYMYAYHYQRPDGTFVFRYDNTPHFPTLPTFPHHKHAGSESNVMSADPPAFQAVLREIQGLMTASKL